MTPAQATIDRLKTFYPSSGTHDVRRFNDQRRIPLQARQGAFSRGRLSKIRGETRKANPFDLESPYFVIWEEGYASAQAERRRIDE